MISAIHRLLFCSRGVHEVAVRPWSGKPVSLTFENPPYTTRTVFLCKHCRQIVMADEAFKRRHVRAVPYHSSDLLAADGRHIDDVLETHSWFVNRTIDGLIDISRGGYSGSSLPDVYPRPTPPRTTGSRGCFHGGPLPSPPPGVDPDNPDFSDPATIAHIQSMLPQGASSSVMAPKTDTDKERISELEGVLRRAFDYVDPPNARKLQPEMCYHCGDPWTVEHQGCLAHDIARALRYRRTPE